MTAGEDRNFDPLHQRFKQNIYASLKGRLRLAILEHDLGEHVPLPQAGGWRVLDAGCGMGDFSRQLVEQGHEVLLCDISGEQLNVARSTLESTGCSNWQLRQGPYQQLVESNEPPFDLVLSHAVLEWLADPYQGVLALRDLVRPGGWLSLLFFNRHALVYRHLLNGNFKKLRSDNLAGEGKYLTPDNPLFPEQVCEWLQDADMTIVASRGVRCFVDFMHRGMRDKLPFEELLEMELHYSAREPYRSLGRYLHIIAQRNPTR